MSKQIYVLWFFSALFLASGLFFMARIFENSASLALYVLAALSYILGLIGAALLAFLTNEKKVFYALAGLLFILVFVFYQWHFLHLLSSLALAGAVLELERRTNKELEEKVHFSFYRDARRPMTILFLAVIFLASLNLYIASADEIRKDPQQFYNQTAQRVVNGLEPVLAARLENFSLQSNLVELLSRFGDGTPEENRQALAQPEEQVFDIFGDQYRGDQPVGEVFFQVVRSRVVSIFEPIKSLIPFFYAVLLFLTLRIAVPVLVFASRLLGAGIFKLGLRFNFWRLVTKEVQVEVPELT